MKQLKYDAKVYEDKINKEHELYMPDEQEDLSGYESAIADSINMNTHVQYQRYTAHVYGRQRCYKMMLMSREDLMNARQTYLVSQKAACEDLTTIFNSLGGLIDV